MRRKMIALVAMALLGTGPAHAANRCINDWSEAAPIVRQEGLYTVERLAKEARGHIDGNIIKTTLCNDDGTWVFRIIVRIKGNLKMMTVNARKPFDR